MNPIKSLLLRYIKEDRPESDGLYWYNARKFIKYIDDYYVFWLTGQRRLGKTDLFLRLACDLWSEYGLKTMWLRNKKVELEDPAFLGDFLNDAKDLGWADEKWHTETDGVHDENDELFVKFQSISTFSNRRGGAHPDVIMMVFDEFMPEDRKYPKMCASGLMSLTKTVFSGRHEARLFCLSNITSAANPYYVKMRIYPGKDDVTLFPEKRMLIERCRGYHCALEEGNPWNDVYRAAGVQNYASEEEDEMLKLIRRTPKGCNPAPFIFLNDGIYYREYRKGNISYYSEYKGSTKDVIIYTPNLRECSDKVNMIMPFMRKDIGEMLQLGCIRFDNPNVMMGILSMVYEAV